MCKCGEQMARRNEKLLDACERHDGDNSVCKSPGLPDREETLVDMASFNFKLAELTQAAEVEVADWRRTWAAWVKVSAQRKRKQMDSFK